MVHTSLEKLKEGNPLDEDELSEVFAAMFKGEMDADQIKSFLLGLKEKGERGVELKVGAKHMRQMAAQLGLPQSIRPLADNCGTGGDGSNSFNISTASAIVAATAGVHVAKHGNRSVSSKCGSADLFFEAGLPDSLTPESTAELLLKTGLTFFFAPHFHPVMKYVMPVRKALGVRTIFNLLGPLANPISPEFQLVGVGDQKYLDPMAEALLGLQVKRGLVVHSQDGLDEISPAAITDVRKIDDGKIGALTINPSKFGIHGSLQDLAGGDAKMNYGILNSLLDGETSTISQTVAINAAALMWVSGKSKTIEDGFTTCTKLLASGRCREFFDSWIRAAKSLKK